MELELVVYISVGVLSGAWLLLAVCLLCLWSRHRTLRRTLDEMAAGKFRAQKLKLKADNEYAYQNPSIEPGEELSRRGYSIYKGREQDVESNHSYGRQASNPIALELQAKVRERPSQPPQPQQPTTAPPFLLEAIEANKRKSQNLNNPVAKNTRPRPETNTNFIY